jgi:hypothetical protein
MDFESNLETWFFHFASASKSHLSHNAPPIHLAHNLNPFRPSLRNENTRTNQSFPSPVGIHTIFWILSPSESPISLRSRRSAWPPNSPLKRIACRTCRLGVIVAADVLCFYASQSRFALNHTCIPRHILGDFVNKTQPDAFWPPNYAILWKSPCLSIIYMRQVVGSDGESRIFKPPKKDLRSI